MQTLESTDAAASPDSGDLATWALTVASAALDRPVLMTSSWPPAGRDLDLLCPEREREVLQAAYLRAGFLSRGAAPPRRVHTKQWIALRGSEIFAVDLNPVARYGLPAEEIRALFADAAPGPAACIRIPAPHHRLLLAARRLARAAPEPRRLDRLRSALASDPAARAHAREHAAAWGAEGGLRALERILAGGPAPSRAERLCMRRELVAAHGRRRELVRSAAAAALVRLPARSRVIAVSGLDGAGKSTQVQALEQTLAAVGVPVVVCWRPLGHSPLVRAVRRAGKRVLGGTTPAAAPPTTDAPARTWDANPRTRQVRERSSAATHLWAAYVGLATATGYRLMAVRHAGRGRVLIFDRHALDTIAQLEYFYGRGAGLPVQAAIVRVIAPRAAGACLLDVPAAVAHGRKPLQYEPGELERMADCYRRQARGMGIPTLDGTEPIARVSERIAVLVWRALAR